MTEGIIQEVISKERKDLKDFKDEIYDTQQRELCELFDKYLRNIQQELIERIKKEFQYCKPLLSLDKYTTLQKRLIGDNID